MPLLLLLSCRIILIPGSKRKDVSGEKEKSFQLCFKIREY